MLLDLLGALLSPPRCACCDEPVRHLRAFCPRCAAATEPPPPHPYPTPVAAVGAYGGSLAQAIHRLKYEGRSDLARPLGDLLAAQVAALAASFDAVVPVPLAPGRLDERGYNQAALLALRVGARLDAPVEPLALRRVVETGKLAQQQRGQRAATIAGAFEARASLAGRRLLLVDDVLTTGATLGACRAAVEAAGGACAAVAVVARVERWHTG